MTFKLYLICFAVALLGMALQTVLKIKSLQDKATAANVKFTPSMYFKKDILSIIASMITIVLFLFFVENFLKWKPAVIDYIKIIFGFVGYTGSDIASSLFGVVGKRINSIINVKTDTADNATGTMGTLTSIEKPKP